MDEMTALVYDLMQKKTPPWEWADLARAMKTTDQRVYNWRKRRIPPEVYRQLADVLGVSVDLLTGREHSTIKPPAQAVEPARPQPQTITKTVERLGELLARASPSTRQAVADLLLRYAQEPEEGSRIAQAIEFLLREETKDDPPTG